MTDIGAYNKRIAKNTILLYIRMIVLMVVNLYTSRVVLQALGVEDFGLYNAIAGFIAMFSMISASITGAVSRFITFVLGQKDYFKLKKVFSTSLIILLTLALIIVILVEIGGVWFLNTHMTIPNGREVAANWLLQFSLLTFILNLWSVPYNASLIAHERMKAFAYIGIFEGCANLAIAFGILYFPWDSLIVYGILMCLIAFVTRLIYNIYCKQHFAECSFQWVFDKILFKEMFSFAGWNFIGSISGLFREQGINLLFNVYNGPAINAARGLASQVQTAVTKFSQNFYMAVQPQITKSYANNKISETHDLVMRSGRLASLLLAAIILPIVAETEMILSIWLNKVPDYTISFVKIILVYTLIESFSTPLIHLMLATGHIKKYQIVVGIFNMLNFPIAWLILYCCGSPELAQGSVILFSIMALFLRLIMLVHMTRFPAKQFLKNTVIRCLCIIAISQIPSIIILLNFKFSFQRFCLNVVLTELVLISMTILFGLNTDEKAFVIQKTKSILKHN